jgi:hypothetical protein
LSITIGNREVKESNERGAALDKVAQHVIDLNSAPLRKSRDARKNE